MIRSLMPLAMAMLTGAAPAKVDMAARILPPVAVPGKSVEPFVKVPAGKLALVHVRVIDGTGAAAQHNRTLLIADGKIAGIQPDDAAVPSDYRIIDATGKSVIPGIVGMHDHQYYVARPNTTITGSELPVLLPQMTYSSPRMYLAGGVTTLRTAGSVEPYADLNMKILIDAGTLPGPHMDVTGPYLEGAGNTFVQMHQLQDGEETTRTVNFWADQGVTSFKAYKNITRSELKAAIDAAHGRGFKITGHLCSVTYQEAAALGIDNLEHGFFADTDSEPGKPADRCPEKPAYATLAGLTPDKPEAAALIATLVKAKVAITSTLPVFEAYSPRYGALPERQLTLLSPEARSDYLKVRVRVAGRTEARKAEQARLWANDLAMERAFVDAGGLLLAGPDPTGNGDVLPGFGDQRAIELLVEAGFSPVEAISIGTLNGAKYLGLADRIGSIAVGKDADLVLLTGAPATNIADIEHVETVFKDGIGYDPGLLLDSVRGRYGQY